MYREGAGYGQEARLCAVLQGETGANWSTNKPPHSHPRFNSQLWSWEMIIKNLDKTHNKTQPGKPLFRISTAIVFELKKDYEKHFSKGCDWLSLVTHRTKRLIGRYMMHLQSQQKQRDSRCLRLSRHASLNGFIAKFSYVYWSDDLGFKLASWYQMHLNTLARWGCPSWLCYQMCQGLTRGLLSTWIFSLWHKNIVGETQTPLHLIKIHLDIFYVHSERLNILNTTV